MQVTLEEIAENIAKKAREAIDSGREPKGNVLSIRGHGYERRLGEIKGTDDEALFEAALNKALAPLTADPKVRFDRIHIGVDDDDLHTLSYQRRG